MKNKVTKDTVSIPSKAKETSGEKEAFAYYETIGGRSTQEDALVGLHDLDQESHLQNLTPQEVGHRMWSTHKELDSRFTQENPRSQSGTTASSNYYDGKGNIITATLADACAFAVIYDLQGHVLKTVRLNSKTHKPSEESEKQRIKALGGAVTNFRGTPRVNGVLAVSRAIGDNSSDLKGDNGDCLISADSTIDITSIEVLTSGISKPVGRIDLIVTCDGFTDGTENQTKEGHEDFLKKSLEQTKNLKGASLCKHLAQCAEKGGSTDNISVAVQTIWSHGTASTTPAFIGVYDGHMDAAASSFVARQVGTVFRQQCALSPQHYAKNQYSVHKNKDVFVQDNAQHLDAHARQPQISPSIKPESQHLQKQSNAILFKLFEKQYLMPFLKKFNLEINKLDDIKQNLMKRHEEAASQEITKLIKKLNCTKTTLIPFHKKNFDTFISTCQNYLDQAEQGILKDHRDANFCLRGIQNAINWLASCFSKTPLIRTDSLIAVNQMKEELEKMKNEADVPSGDLVADMKKTIYPRK